MNNDTPGTVGGGIAMPNPHPSTLPAQQTQAPETAPAPEAPQEPTS